MNAAVSEGAGESGALVVRRNRGLQTSLRVFYKVNGNAARDADYERLPGFVDIPAGSAEAAIDVIPLDDELHEATERVVVQLTPPPRRARQYRLGARHRLAVQIADNDEAPVEEPPAEEPAEEPAAVVDTSFGLYIYTGAGLHTRDPFEVSRRLNPTAPANVQIATDVSPWIHQIEFFEGDRSLGVIRNTNPAAALQRARDPYVPTFTFTLSNLPEGTYTITAVAITGDPPGPRIGPSTAGQQIFARPLTFTVRPAP